MVNATQLCRVNGVRTADIAAADLGLRGQMGQVLSFLRRRIPGFENAFILDSADVPGFRETRRIEGDYTLTEDDISAGRTFPDVMVHPGQFLFRYPQSRRGRPKRKASRRRAPPGLTTSRTAASFPVGWRICLRRGAVYRGHTKHIPPIG